MTFLSKIFKIDLRTLAFFRISLGIVIIVDLINRSRSLIAHYTDSGVLPRDVIINFFSENYFSLYYINGSISWSVFLFIINFLCSIALIFGYKTRLTIVLCWILNLSLQNRNLILLQGGDVLLRLLIFWAMFLPLGSKYSIDNALSTNKDKKEPNFAISGATFAVLIQVSIVYFFNFLHKSKSNYYHDGTAIYFTLMLDDFATSLGIWFRQFEFVLKPLTFIVLAWEAIGSFLLLIPIWKIKVIAISLFAFMHVCFSLFLNIGLFPLISLLALTLFIPGELWDILEKKSHKKNITIYYDGGCNFCKKFVLIIKEFFLLKDSQIKIAQSDSDIEKQMTLHNSWIIKSGNDKLYNKGEAFLYILSKFFPFKYIKKILFSKFITKIFNSVYHFISFRRSFFGDLTKNTFKFREIKIKSHIITNIFCILTIFVIIFYNISTLPSSKLEINKKINSAMLVLKLDQKWNLFTPLPESKFFTDGWFVFTGKLINGESVDPFSMEYKEPNYNKPDSIIKEYKGYRWRKYLTRAKDYSTQEYKNNLGRYLCTRWNKKEKGDSQLKSFKVFFISESTDLGYKEGPLKKNVILNQNCF